MKKIFLLVMAAVIMTVCVACAGNNAGKQTKQEMYTVNIYNRTGEDVTNISLKETNTEKAIASDKITNGGWIGLSIKTAANEATGLPDLTLTYDDAAGSTHAQTLTLKGITTEVTLLKSGLEMGAPKN